MYKLHSDAYMAEQQEKRARALDEARKRKEYLIAHGIEKEGLFGFGTVEGDARKEKRRRKSEALNEKRLREKYNEELVEGTYPGGSVSLKDYQNMIPSGALGHDGKTMTSGAPNIGETVEETGKKAKKWFGIW